MNTLNVLCDCARPDPDIALKPEQTTPDFSSLHPRRLLLRDQAVIRLTTRRTHGATIATVGKAIGHVVAQLFSHCSGNPEVIPCEVARTNAETIPTMTSESSALKRMGANRAGIRMLILLCKV